MKKLTNSVFVIPMSSDIYLFSFQLENEVKYNNTEKTSPKTDYLCDICGWKVAVSVTRAMSHLKPIKRQMVEKLLIKKVISK